MYAGCFGEVDPLSWRTLECTGGTIHLQDARSAKRSRGSQEPVLVVPDSLEAPYVQNMPLDIDELMNSQ
jgi:hypothetical protein